MPVNDLDIIRHLLVIEDLEGQRTLPLQGETYSIGRDVSNSLVIHDPSVSRQHAILLRITVPGTEQYGFRIIDGNLRGKRSTNGLLVNGTKRSSYDLKHGDVIKFGNQAQAKYYTFSNLTEQEFSQSWEVEDLSSFLSQRASSFETLMVSDAEIEEASETAIAHLASFPELIPNPIIEIDINGKITYLNPAAVLEFPRLREVGKQHPMLVGLPSIVKRQEGKSLIREVEVGSKVFEQSIHYFPESDLIRTFVVREITEQKRAEVELRQRDRLLQGVAEAANYLLTEMNSEVAFGRALATLGQAAKADRAYLFENHPHPATGEIALNLRFEWTRPDVTPSQHHWQNQPYDGGLSRWYDTLSTGQTLGGLTRDFPLSEQEYLSQDEVQSFLLVPLLLENEFWGCLGLADCQRERQWSTHEESTLSTMAASVSAAKQRQQTEERIRYQALHDVLTGLPNRLLFDEQLAKALPNATRSGESLAVMFVDLDRFKTINDTLGHTLGDRLLQEVAQRLRDCLRAGDTVARWGGDEFTVLLPRVTQIEEVSQVAERIVQALGDTFYLDDHELYITTSLGIALFDEESPDAESLIRYADTALYYAKEQGRNNYQFYDDTMNSQNPELLTLARNLHYALEREEFVVYYQPRINLSTGKITGMEALLRWQHPEMGLVSPNVFIPLAEESGLIIPIGEWVLRTACIQNRAWQAAGLPPLMIAVNLSPKQFRQANLVERVAKILAETELEPGFLELEITESVAIQNLDYTSMVLQTLKQTGIHLAIDDFGTGHSSLSRLQNLPLHNLKIDQSFIRGLATNSKVAHIVTAIVTLGQSLGLRLTAEGVESEEELSFLQSINCEDGQGFLFSRPVPVDKATEILQTHLVSYFRAE